MAEGTESSPAGPAAGPLGIVHVSTDDVTGGAARCAYRLHRGLVADGHESRMLVRRKRSDDPTVTRFRPGRAPGRRLARRWRRWRIRRDHDRWADSAPEWREPFHGDRSEYGGEVAGALPECDVVHLHWVSGLVDLVGFFDRIPPDLPVVWTLHDMNLFTGGCHYDWGCGRYRERCGACPQLGSGDEQDLSREVWRRKDELFSALSSDRIRLVTPSRWLAHRVEESSLLSGRFPVEVIPYGLDTEGDFTPRDRGFARDLLDVPAEADVLLFAAHSVENARKGFGLLREALEGLACREDLWVLSLGKGEPELPRGIGSRHLGYVSEDRFLSVVYSAADLFVIPSRQDNLPATVLESMACGTPVVGFAAGGIPEMVRPGETGGLAEDGDVDDLRRVLENLLDDDARRVRLSTRCREVAVREYALERQARDYAAVYRSLTARGPEGREGRAPDAGNVGPAGDSAETGPATRSALDQTGARS